MKGLRLIRIILSVIFLALSVAFLVTWPHLRSLYAVRQMQIIPSAIASSLGATIVWILITFIIGRVYCSSVCPVGTFQDFAIRLRGHIPGLRKPFSYRMANPFRYQILLIYIICTILGIGAVAFWFEPWSIMHNICGVFNPPSQQRFWHIFGISAATGMTAGVASALLLFTCALFTGRGFCTDVCPIGIALGAASDYSLLHIEIDPDKCINCMKCEEVCKSRCVKVVSRYVDNSRCVRCFDCLAVCPNDAIRLQANRNRRATPLVRKVSREPKG